MNMTKQQAIALFGDGAALGRALGITKGAISQWPDDLDQGKTDRVIGALIRLGRAVPDGFATPTPPPAASEQPATA
jgi:hypothetical protein